MFTTLSRREIINFNNNQLVVCTCFEFGPLQKVIFRNDDKSFNLVQIESSARQHFQCEQKHSLAEHNTEYLVGPVHACFTFTKPVHCFLSKASFRKVCIETLSTCPLPQFYGKTPYTRIPPELMAPPFAPLCMI